MTPFKLNLQAFFEFTGLENIYKCTNKTLSKMSLVPGRLNFLSLQKNMYPTNNRGGAPYPPPPNAPPTQQWEIIPQGLLLVAGQNVR